MKKILFAFLFILIGLLLGAGAMFALNKLNEKPAPIVEDNNEEVPVEDENNLVTYADGYYSVYYQQCAMSLPFPEATEFSYLDSNSSDFVESALDSDKGWYLKDSEVVADQTMFFKHFEKQVAVSLVALPHATTLGSDYVAAHVSVMCYSDTAEKLEEAFARIKSEVDSAESIEEFEPFKLTDKKVVMYNGEEAIQFQIKGGFFGDTVYTLLRNDTHVYLIQNITMSSDEKIEETSEYIEKNISI
jgi:hypothetical protein